MKNKWNAFGLCLLLICLFGGRALATTTTTELVGNSWGIEGAVANETSTSMTYSGGIRTVTIGNLNNNTANNGPHIYLLFSPVLDMRKYQTLTVKYKLTSTNSYITADGKDIVLTFCDNLFRYEMLSANGNTIQQNVPKHLAPGSSSWQTLTIDLRPMNRSQATEIDMWLEYLHYNTTDSYTIQFDSIALTGYSPGFDGENISPATAPSSKTVSKTLTTSDNLAVQLTSAGALVGLTKAPAGGGTAVAWGNNAQAGGFLVRDTTTTSAPTQLTGTVSTITGGYSVTSNSTALHLNTTCSYTTSGNMIHVALSATNTSSSSRYLTYYFALPLAWKSWTWQGELTRSTAVNQPYSVGTAGPFYEEETKQYPVAALNSSANSAGVALAVPLNEPRNYRIVYDEYTGVFFVAFDIALTNLTGPNGSLNTGTADVYLYAADPTWGLRSGLQTFYANFSSWFTQRTGGGGWGTGDAVSNPGVRFAWNQPLDSTWTADHADGILNLLYIDPQQVNIAMTDLDPSSAEAKTRVLNLSGTNGTTAQNNEWTAVAALGYTNWSYSAAYVAANSLESYWIAEAEAAYTSGQINSAGNYVFNINSAWEYAPASGGVGWGMTPVCNMDPAIPGGNGALVTTCLQLTSSYVTGQIGSAPDGWALDEFIFDESYDYHSANFQYSPFPITFERDVTAMAVPIRLTTAAWLQNLNAQSWDSGKVVMGNLQGNYTFAAPYIDLFGNEGYYEADPAYARVMANQRNATYLPYVPQPDADTYYNLLYGIYPGNGLDSYQYSATMAPLDVLFAAGWQPVTYATASVSNIRVERYGTGDPFYLVCYNTDSSSHSFTLSLNTTGLEVSPAKATVLFAGSTGGTAQGTALTVSSGTVPSITLAAGETCVLTVQASTTTHVTFTSATIAGDSDVLAPTIKQAVVAALAFTWYNGSSPLTINGVGFTQVDASGASSFASGLVTTTNLANGTGSWGSSGNSLSTNYETLVGSGMFNGTYPSAPTSTVTLNGLAVGTAYTVRFWANDELDGAHSVTIASTSDGSSSTAPVGSNTPALGSYVTATFIAASPTQTFNVTISDGYHAGVNAIEILQGH